MFETGSFVRYYPEGKGGDNYVGFVQGTLGTVMSVCFITRKQSLLVHEEECEQVSLIEVLGGLVGFIAHHKKFGAGEIVDEERINNILLVRLLDAEGNISEKIPLTNINLCCACC